MIDLRRSEDRGASRFHWLDSRHTFSFGDYHDPRHMGVSALRVLNEDRVIPGAGFPPHGHRDMEIVSIVLDGAMAHRDSTGGGSTIRPGDVQLMHAGSGITHSEYNAQPDAPLHFLQIWITPDQRGIEPGYQQRRFFDATELSGSRLILAPDGADGALTIHQDVRAWQIRLAADESTGLPVGPQRQGYLHLARGAVVVQQAGLEAGDGARLRNLDRVQVQATEAAELVFFNLP